MVEALEDPLEPLGSDRPVAVAEDGTDLCQHRRLPLVATPETLREKREWVPVVEVVQRLETFCGQWFLTIPDEHGCPEFSRLFELVTALGEQSGCSLADLWVVETRLQQSCFCEGIVQHRQSSECPLPGYDCIAVERPVGFDTHFECLCKRAKEPRFGPSYGPQVAFEHCSQFLAFGRRESSCPFLPPGVVTVSPFEQFTPNLRTYLGTLSVSTASTNCDSDSDDGESDKYGRNEDSQTGQQECKNHAVT